jgi:hypothetical protein
MNREDNEIEGGSTRSHSLENLVWKKLWTCRNMEYGMMVTPSRNYKYQTVRVVVTVKW